MVIVRKVLADVVTPNRGTFLSLGFLATLWTASGNSPGDAAPRR